METRTRTSSRRPVTLIGAGGLLAASVIALAGCASPGASAGGDGPKIVATTTQVGDFTRELLGGDAELTQLLSPGQSAHGFDPSAAQLLALTNADALVVNGGGLESWLDDAIEASGFDGVLIDASTGIELFGTDDHAHDHDDEADAAEDARDHDHDHDDDAGTDAADAHADDHDHADDHEGHDHGDGNPHIWTDPELAEDMVENIADGLATVDGLDAANLEANETAYLAKLEALDDWIADNVEQVPAAERLLVTNHDAFTYFVDAYEVTFVGSIIPSFDDNAEPSAAEIDDLVAKIESTGVAAVFSEASLSPKAAETIAAESGVAVYSGPDALYGDSLGEAGSEGATYLGSQLHNARLILESWGVVPTALPAALQG
ncbi:metal ABC transporter substrate-binding protein [Agromyces sp. NPDC057679]|uniref:metal ABC transporter substrate-binding protein n=1 Tax=Agromyces sp. NPDC057679 TaxID=3346207 RepID=UPI0036701FEA